jgi:formiminotetrahydrofolate cyclodeaminase
LNHTEHEILSLIEKENAGDVNYLDYKTSDLLDAFGQGNHIPGSGSAAVLSALISIELLKTVLQLSLSKDAYKERWDEFQYILEIITKEFKPKLIDLFNSDSREFHKVSYLRRLRDKAEFGSKERERYGREAIEQLRIATEIPIEVCEISFRLLSYALPILDKGFKGAKGDSGVAISNLLSSISGSLFVIFLNLKSFNKSKWKDEKMNKAVELAKRYTEIQRNSFAKVIELYNESNDGGKSQLTIDY